MSEYLESRDFQAVFSQLPQRSTNLHSKFNFLSVKKKLLKASALKFQIPKPQLLRCYKQRCKLVAATCNSINDVFFRENFLSHVSDKAKLIFVQLMNFRCL